jgi:chemotaxis protein MotB
MADQPIIRKVVKKGGHGGHHGGSWKVAYADFVTAMMAFFLVMWILGLDQPNKAMIQDYFNDPQSFMREYRKDPAGFVKTYRGGNSPLGKGSQVVSQKTALDLNTVMRAAGRQKFEATKKAIDQAIGSDPDLRALKNYVDVRVTNEGLKIELLEARESLFFQSGSARVEPRARRLLALVAGKLGALSNPIAVEGHTDVVPYRGRTDYSNWELSADRANAARRVLEAAGRLRPGQIVEVRGYADKKLRDRAQPAHFSNRRVSVLVPFHRAPVWPDSSSNMDESDDSKEPNSTSGESGKDSLEAPGEHAG